jgi:chorismate mutase
MRSSRTPPAPGTLGKTLSALIAAAALVLTALPARAAGTDAGEAVLMNVIAQVSRRLTLADTVARYKWSKSQDITDTPRENAMLKDVTRRAPAYGVEPKFARTFFRDQIDANKSVQQGLIAAWQQIPPPPVAVPDLAHSIRPELDQLTVSMLTALGRIEPLRQADDCPIELAHSLTEWHRLNPSDSLHEQALKQALAHLCVSGGVGATA